MGWKHVKTKVDRVTGANSRKFASMTAAPGDRPFKDRRLAVYKAAYERGEFRPCTWAFAKCKETGEVFRVNGKHTSTMFSQMENIPGDTYVSIEEYECDTIHDISRLYSTFDSKSQLRSADEIYHSFAANIPELANVPRRVINNCIGGLALYKWRYSYGDIPAVERAELLFDHTQFALWYSAITDDRSDYKHMARVPVVASMFGSWQKSPKEATEFWIAVRDQTGISPDLPDRRLATYLMTTSINLGKESRANCKKKASPHEFYAKCTLAWNSYRSGETSGLRVPPNGKMPIHI